MVGKGLNVQEHTIRIEKCYTRMCLCCDSPGFGGFIVLQAKGATNYKYTIGFVSCVVVYTLSHSIQIHNSREYYLSCICTICKCLLGQTFLHQ